jgi:hypothetical protein
MKDLTNAKSDFLSDAATYAGEKALGTGWFRM